MAIVLYAIVAVLLWMALAFIGVKMYKRNKWGLYSEGDLQSYLYFAFVLSLIWPCGILIVTFGFGAKLFYDFLLKTVE